MKQLLSAFSLALLFCFFANAQAPLSIPYQAVARDASGNLLVNQHICVQFGVYTAVSGGSPVYQEHQTVTTNPLGLFTIKVGTGGVVTAGTNLGAIGWASNPTLFMQVDLDLTGACSGYTTMGRSQMMSVPYALYAGSSAPSGSASGDLSGSYPAPIVSAIQGHAVSSTAPANGQVLEYNSGSNNWVPASAGTGLFTAGTGLAWSGSTLNNTGVTSVATGSGLTGGPITTTGTIGIATGGVTNAMLANTTVNYPVGAGLTGGGSVSLGGTATTIGIAAGGITNAMLGNSSITVTAGSGLGGGGSVALGGTVTLTNAGVTSVTAGTGISVSAGTGGVTITNSAPAAANAITGSGTANYHSKFTAANTIGNSLIYDNGTSVGLNTASPAALWHVAGGGAILGTTGTTANPRTLALMDNSTTELSYGAYPGNWTSAIQIQDNTNNRFLWMSPLDNASGNNARIMAAGTGLDIYTNGTASTNGTLGFSQNTSGNVGIGTTNPDQKLTVAGNVDVGLNYYGFGGDVTQSSTAGICWHTIGSPVGNYAIYRTSGAWTSPNYQQLEVDWPTGVIINGGSSYGRSGTLLQPSGGNVGIATLAPAYPLDVNGIARATEFIGAGQCYEKWGSWGCSSGYNEVLDGRPGGQESFSSNSNNSGDGFANLVCVSTAPAVITSWGYASINGSTYRNRLMRATTAENSMDRVQPRCAICCKGGCYTAFGVNTCSTGYTAMYTGRTGGVESYNGGQYQQKTLCIDVNATVEESTTTYGTSYSTRLMRHREGSGSSYDNNGMDEVTNVCAVCCRQ